MSKPAKDAKSAKDLEQKAEDLAALDLVLQQSYCDESLHMFIGITGKTSLLLLVALLKTCHPWNYSRILKDCCYPDNNSMDIMVWNSDAVEGCLSTIAKYCSS